MRKNKKIVTPEVIETSTPNFSLENLAEDILNAHHEKYQHELTEHYMNPYNCLYPTVSSPNGPVEPHMGNLLDLNARMDRNSFNPASVYSVTAAQHNLVSVPTPFITFGQKVDDTLDEADFVRKVMPVEFQYNYSKFIIKTTEENIRGYLRSQLRHALTGFMGDICDEYRNFTNSIDSEVISYLNNQINDLVWDLQYKIEDVININNPTSYSPESNEAVIFDGIVSTTLIPNLLGAVFETVDRITSSKMYNHAVSDYTIFENIIECNGFDGDEAAKNAEYSKVLKNKIPMNVRDIHACFTSATFIHYKNLQRELQIIINLFRIQLFDTFGAIVNDGTIKEMYEAGKREKNKVSDKEDSRLRTASEYLREKDFMKF